MLVITANHSSVPFIKLGIAETRSNVHVSTRKRLEAKQRNGEFCSGRQNVGFQLSRG